MKKYVRPLVAVVMAITFMALYLTKFSHVITFHEQHHLFVFTSDYFSNSAHEYGLLRPLTEFVVQFGFYPWLGAIIWTAIIVGVYLMVQSIVRRLTGWRDMLQLSAILPCWMFFQTVSIDVVPDKAVGAFLAVVAIWVAALVAGRFLKRPRRGDSGGKWWWLLAGPALFALIFCIFNHQFYGERTVTMIDGKERVYSRDEIKRMRRTESVMIRADQAMRRKDWPKVQQLTEQLLTESAKNHLMAYFRAMALYHQGKLADRLFDIPALYGVRTLFFPWKADKNQAEYGGYVYEQLGALNSATHWEFEALVGWGETAQHLINLSRYYIEAGKPDQALKFIYPLRHTLFYRGAARQLDQWLAAGDVPGLRDAHADTPAKPGRWDAVLDISSDLGYLVNYDPQNEMAREYLLMSLLLQNKIGLFYEVLKRVYPDGNDSLPEVYQQALCLARLGYGEDKLRADGFVISPKVEADMKAYLAEHAKGQMARFTAAQRRTLWYYIHFFSPEGKTVNV